MNEELAFYIAETTELMEKAIYSLERELIKIRAGKANPSMLDNVFVDYYGAKTTLGYGIPTILQSISTIKNQDARTIVITPFEKKTIAEIEKAIFQANLGVTPQNDGENIRISLPPPTEERRRDLVKQAKQLGETAKISIRSARKEANEAVKSLIKEGLSEDEGKDGEDKVQQLTNSAIAKVDKILEAKDKEIMTI